jgi:hypothetical protein
MSDAAPSPGSSSPRGEAAGATGASSITGDIGPVKAGDTSSTEAAKPDAEPVTAKHDGIASPDDKPAENKSQDAATSGIKAAGTDTKGTAEEKADAVEAKTDNIKAEAPKPDASKSTEKPNESVNAVTDAATSPPDINKDQTHLPDPVASKPDWATTAAPKRTGPISVFISRKDSKLYVRQNFAALFDVPVTIAPSDRPLGTHVFTTQVDKDDANVLHWSVISLPVPARHAERRDEDERVSRRHKIVGKVEIKPMPVPDSPAEALDRLTIPAEAMARITAALSTSSSIIVSDQGIAAGETGEGTDFIVSLR